MKLDKETVGRVDDAMGKAIAKLNRNGSLDSVVGDIKNDAWIKVLTKYDPARVEMLPPTKYRKMLRGPMDRTRDKWANSICPVSAFAYVIAYRLALDYHRGRSSAMILSRVNHDSLEKIMTINPLRDQRTVSLGEVLNTPVSECIDERFASVAAYFGLLTPSEQTALREYLESDDQPVSGCKRVAKCRAIKKLAAFMAE